MKFTSDAVRERADAVRNEIAAIEAVTVPMRDEYDRYCAEVDTKRREMATKLREAEAPLFDLKNELSLLTKALGGKSMSVKSA